MSKVPKFTEADKQAIYEPGEILKQLAKALNTKNLSAAENVLLRASNLMNSNLDKYIKFQLLSVKSCDDNEYVLFLLNFLKLDENKLWDRLKIAVIRRDESGVQSAISLLDKDEKLEISEEKETLAYYAFGRWNIHKRQNILKLILSKLNPRFRDGDERNLLHQFLHYFASKDDTDLINIVEILVNIGISIDDVDSFKYTALHHSINTQNLDLINYLIKDYKMDVNAKTLAEECPIHLAAEFNNKYVIDVLFNEGAFIHAKNYFDQTAVQIAKIYKNDQVVNYLVAVGADATDWPFCDEAKNERLIEDVRKL